MVIILALLWGLAVATASPAFHMHVFKYKETKFECVQNYGILGDHFSARMKYLWSIAFLSTLLPVICLVVLYSASIHQLKNRHRASSIAAIQIQQQENRKVMKMFLLLVIVFVFLTGPNSCVLMASSYVRKYAKLDIHEITMYINLNIGFYCVYLISSVINPFVYAHMHKNIRTVKNNALHSIRRRSRRGMAVISGKQRPSTSTVTSYSSNGSNNRHRPSTTTVTSYSSQTCNGKHRQSTTTLVSISSPHGRNRSASTTIKPLKWQAKDNEQAMMIPMNSLLFTPSLLLQRMNLSKGSAFEVCSVDSAHSSMENIC